MTRVSRTAFSAAILAVLLGAPCAFLVLPRALAAQQGPRGRPTPPWEDSLPVDSDRGTALGVTTYSGGDWQPSGVDGQMTWRTRGLPVASVGLGVRLGSFVQNQAVWIGGSQGFFAAAVGSARRPLANLVAVGSESYPSYLRAELILEGAAAVNFNSPLPQGGANGILAAMLGFSFGGRYPMDQSFVVALGPAWFVGKTSDWRMQVSFRMQMPRGGAASPASAGRR